MTAIALIPARGGSRGIPGKNVKPIAGRPLIHWTLRAALACPHISRVVVTTDDEAIAATAQLLPGVEVIGRDPATATATASTESVIADALGRLGAFDDLVLIQATSPLLTAADLAAGFAKRAAAGATSCLSVVRQTRFLWEQQADGTARPVNYDPLCRPRRQDFSGLLVENGAFYLSTRAAVAASGCRISGRTVVHEMAPAAYAELDEPEDWPVVEALLRQRSTARAARVKLVVCDVDGTLTDGGMYYGPGGDALKRFDTRDAAGLLHLREKHGVELGIITAEDTPIVSSRAAKLRIPRLALGCKDKATVMRAWCAELGILPEEAAFIGDDRNDQGVLAMVGFAACPADAAPEVKALADHVCTRRGGRGAVRELADLLHAARA